MLGSKPVSAATGGQKYVWASLVADVHEWAQNSCADTERISNEL